MFKCLNVFLMAAIWPSCFAMYCWDFSEKFEHFDTLDLAYFKHRVILSGVKRLAMKWQEIWISSNGHFLTIWKSNFSAIWIWPSAMARTGPEETTYFYERSTFLLLLLYDHSCYSSVKYKMFNRDRYIRPKDRINNNHMTENAKKTDEVGPLDQNRMTE